MEEWLTLYDFAEDHEAVKQSQEAALNSAFFGLDQEIALVGTEEWWQATKDGRIPCYEIIGTISRLFMSGHNDWPEFEIDSPSGKTTWTRLGEEGLYRIGDLVKVQYVEQQPKIKWGPKKIKKVIRILLKIA